LVALLSLVAVARAADKQPFKVSGLYTETCACPAPCKCELTGEVPPGCVGVGAFKVSAGDIGGQDLSGVGIAYAGKPGEWIRVYIDAPDKAHRDAAEKLARLAYANWGKMESVKDAKVAIDGTYGAYSVTVDGGSIMKYSTAPILGGDGKTAVAHSNTFDPMTHLFLQAKSTDAVSYHDGGRSIDLDKGRNAFFNDMMQTSGEL
jgi:hypothetical protein